jgi:uncharacterized membrane protein YhhN
MAELIPIPFLILTVTLLVWAEFKLDQRQISFFKPLSTLLVITVALLSFLSPNVQHFYSVAILLGLLLSLGGDLSLMFKSDRAFLLGLVLFLLAHIVYSIAFTVPNGFHPQDLLTGAALLVLGVVVFLYLRPGLGPMQLPVLLYILVIFFMVNRATSTSFGRAFSTTQAWLMTMGAALFALSDLMLAINRFRHPFRLHRLSLIPYYGGQLLIALSPSYFV